MTEELECRALAPGDVAALLTAYAMAVAAAEELAGRMAEHGLTGDAVRMVASLDASAGPTVCLTLSGPAAVRLSGLLSGPLSGGPATAGGPGKHATRTHPPSDRAA